MRILIEDASPGTGGALTSLAALVAVLERRGHDVRVLALAADAAARAGIAKAEALPRVSSERSWAARHTRRALTWVPILRRARPDVVVGNNAPAVNASLAAAAALLGVPYIQYARAEVWPDRATRLALRLAREVITVGPDVTASVRSAGGGAVIEVGEGLAPSQWPARRRADGDRWLWCGASAAHKGLALFVEAYRSVPDAPRAEVCAALLADSPGQPAGRLPALPSGAELHLDAAGSDLDAIRAGALAYFHTALVPEPFGRTILEATAAGLCPVVPDEGSGPRLVSHGRDGLVYRARSASELAAAMRAIAAQPDWARELGDRAAIRATALTAERELAPVVRTLERAARSTSAARCA